MKILSSSASYILLMRSVHAGMQNNAFLQSIKRSFHPSGPNAVDGPFDNYKQVLKGEINRKKMSLAGDAVMLDRMMDDFYVPVYVYIKSILDRRQSQINTATTKHQPLFIGISAPQGCGKTTLTEFLRALFAADGKNCLSVSIDDFYLRKDEQDSLAARYDTNPLLKFRGNAGSHDMPLMLSTLRELKGLGQTGSSTCPSPLTSSTPTPFPAGAVLTPTSTTGVLKTVKVPQYDKSLRGGRGDRADISGWLDVHAPLDVVLFEGWMLGFTPAVTEGEEEGEGKGEDTSISIINDQRHAGISEVNRQLRDYLPLHEMFDAWLVIAVEDEDEDKTHANGKQEMSEGSTTKAAGIDAVYRWRLQAETAMRAAGKPGLTDTQVADFISRFMPAYETYLPRLYAEGPQRRSDEEIPVLKVVVDMNRYPVSSRLMTSNNTDDNHNNNNNNDDKPKSRL